MTGNRANKPRLDRDAKRERTRAELLKAARQVFGRRGYHEATLDEIVAESGLSKGALYYNFESKAVLFLALLEERIDERIAKVEALSSKLSAASSPSTEIEAASTDFIQTMRQSREWRLLFLEFLAHAARDPDFHADFAARARKMRHALTDVIEKTGYDGSVDARAAATVISALANGLAIESLIDPDAFSDELFGQALTALLRGLATPG